MAQYAHLHNHTSASIFDGAQLPSEFAEKIDHLGMDGAAITDHGVLHAWPEFQQEFEKRNLNPILGCEAYLVENFDRIQDLRDKGKTARTESENKELGVRYHQVILAKTQEGMRNLMHLMSWANDEGFYYRPHVDFEQLKKHSEGLITTSSCIQGIIPQTLLGKGIFSDMGKRERVMKACDLVERYLDIFGDDFYIEVHRHGIEDEEKAMEGLEYLADRYNLPVITANDCHYTNENDFWFQDVKTCVSASDPGNPTLVNDPDRTQYAHENLYVKGAQEMVDLIPEFPNAPQNTMKILDECNARLPLDEGEYFFPEFPDLGSEETPHQRLKRECGSRFTQRYPNHTEAHRERMRYELDVIKEMGFSDYFLIVADIVRASKGMGIDVGPGRGSAASSMVTYVLGITDIDPMKYGLLFDRFLNPSRVTMPDIDIDFDDNRREDVFQYIYDRYGEDRVAKTITFSRYKSKGAIKDVGKTFGMEASELNTITKKIPDDYRSDPINEIIDKVEEIRELTEEDERFRKTCRVVNKLYGMESHTGVHAAAVVITPGPLNNYLPTERDRKSDEIKTQFDGDQLEDIGLLKMDILGLKTLREIRMAINLIEDRTGEEFDESVLDERDDEEVFENIFAEGNTRGVFQYHKSGMRHYLSKMKPFKFEHLIAMNALYRPGPIELIPTFIRRMHGEEDPEYFHPDAKPYLEETYGIMVYQEQIMQVARELAGFSLGEADVLRRAIGKKKEKLLMKQKEKFIDGCLDQGNSRETANEVFDLIEKFADYGFNKAHASAYAALGYRQAWLKNYYPTEFFTAVIETESSENRRAALIQNAKNEGVDVLRPDVNKSEKRFRPEGDSIRFGMQSIKHVGKEANGIIEERQRNGDYASFEDLIMRAIPNKSALRSLIQSGGLDSFDLNRATMYENMDPMLEYARKMRDYRRGDRKSEPDKPDIELQAEWPARMKYQQEREVTGTYATGNPIQEYSLIIDHLDGHEEMNRSKRYGDEIYKVFAGTILSVDEAETSNENPMWWVNFMTSDDVHELPMFEFRHEHIGGHLEKDRPMLIIGSADTEGEYAGEHSITGLLPLQQALHQVIELVEVSTDDAEKAHQAIMAGKQLPDGPHTFWVTGPSDGEERTVELDRDVSVDEDALEDLQSLGSINMY